MTFTAADVVAKVRDLAAERPEFVYVSPVTGGGTPSCLYVHTEVRDDGRYLTPGCIIGAALVALGVDTADLHEYDLGDGANGSKVVRDYTGAGSDTSLTRWIDAVQMKQDGGHEWGKAVEYADTYEPITDKD